MKSLVFIKNIIVLTIILDAISSMIIAKAHASTAQGNNYIFDMNIGTDADQKILPYNKPGSFVMKKKVSPTLAPSFTPTPTTIIIPPKTSIKIGYNNTQPESDFRFSISDNVVNFGLLSPTNFIIRKLGITVVGDPSYYYTIIGYENNQLQSEKKQIIPNTTCDDGNCTDEIAGIWTDTLTFGFGYHCENKQGKDCDSNFNNKDMYKKISLGGNNGNGEAILTGNTFQEKQATIVYKINIPGSQIPGNYKNTITYLALPMY